ncbi:MAG: phosphate transport system permease protein [Planctomycetaceae bacterium]|nr:MAG: phosphate transport system permease protein [Planctomycetaceae bacterium]
MNPPTRTSARPSRTEQSGRRSLQRRFSWQRLWEACIAWMLLACALLSVLTTVTIIMVLLYDSALWIPWIPEHRPFFADVSLWEFFTETRWTPQYLEKHFGIWPLLVDTLLITLIAGGIGLPAGLAAAIYMSEYASPRARAVIKPVLELLAGIPTVVYGYFALYFLTPLVIVPVFERWLGFRVERFNALSGGLVVGVMILPTVACLSEDVLRAVPRSLREAAYALGSTRFDVSMKVVVPAALSGILASFLLAVARAIGETMAVTIASGQKPQLTINPLVQVQTMTSYIVNVMKGDAAIGSIEHKSLYAVALVLFVMTLSMNYISQKILRRFREVYH